MSNSHELELEIFRAGDYGDKGKFAETDLEQIATDYNPALHEAPVTVDHTQSGPAYGWVTSLRRQGDRLVARLHQLNEQFLQLLRAGAFKKRSVELYRRFAHTGRPYLRALTFLGARPPAVKGLADVKFADTSDFIQLDYNESLPVHSTSVVLPEILAEARQQIQHLQHEKQRVEAELQQLHRALRQQNLLHFCEELKQQGKFLPAWEKQGIFKFMELLPDSETIQFAETDTAPLTPAQWFKNFLNSLPPLLPLKEIAPAEQIVQLAEDQLPRPTTRAMVCQRSLELHRRVLNLREHQPGISYADALRQILRNQ